MLRKLVAAIAVAGMVGGTTVPGTAYGLGLGEIQLRSTLNQPLDARIDLVELRDLIAGEVLPNIATRADFERAEVARPYFLSTLRFKTVTDKDGRIFIQVSSDKPVVEPYLNFLVEVHWPNGRLLREYTLLLDPPSFSSDVFSAVTPEPKPDPVEVVVAEPVDIVEKPPVETVAEDVIDIAIDEPASNDELAGIDEELSADQDLPGIEQATTDSITLTEYLKESGMSAPDAVTPVVVSDTPVMQPESIAADFEAYQVRKGDTLYEIALRTRPGSDVSVNRMMMALRGRNPDAFIHDNVNLLKQGAVLQVPDQATLDTIDSPTANRFIAQQNREWRDGRSRQAGRVQLDATRKMEVEPVQRGQIEEGRLNIVSPSVDDNADGGADQGGGKADGGRTSELESAITIKQEQLVSLSRENRELNERLRDLEEQIQTLEQLVSLKSDQMSALQSMEELEQESEQIPQADVINETIDYNYSDDSGAAVEDIPVAPGSTTDLQEPVEDDSEKPAPSFVDHLFSDPIYLTGIGGGTVLIAAGIALFIRRRRKQEELDDDDIIPDILKDYDDEEDLDHDIADDLEPVAAPEPEKISQLKPEQEPATEIEPEDIAEAPTEETDVLGEADIYIAYGRFPQAADLLKGAIQTTPDRTDFRIKLMEVLVEMQDAEEFSEQEQQLKAMGDDQAVRRAAELHQRFPDSAFKTTAEIASEASIDNLEQVSLDELEVTVEPSAEFDAVENAGEVEGLEFDLADLEMAEESSSSETAVEEVAPSTPEEDTLPELEDLELDASFAISGDEKEVPAKADVPTSGEFGSELAELDDELANLSSDLNLDVEDLEGALAPGDEAFVKELAEPEEDTAEQNKSVPSAVNLESLTAGLDDETSSLEYVDDDFAFLSDTDEASTKLDLARAYMEMGDADGAKDILGEVINEGNDAQKKEAQDLIDKM